MTYPIAVIIVALIVSAILLIKVVPQFNPYSKVLAQSCLHSLKWS